MNNYIEETATKCEATKPATIADMEHELHANLVELKEMLKSYIGLLYGTKTTENDQPTENPISFISAMDYDVQLSVEVLNLARYLCEGLGV